MIFRLRFHSRGHDNIVVNIGGVTFLGLLPPRLINAWGVLERRFQGWGRFWALYPALRTGLSYCRTFSPRASVTPDQYCILPDVAQADTSQAVLGTNLNRFEPVVGGERCQMWLGVC